MVDLVTPGFEIKPVRLIPVTSDSAGFFVDQLYTLYQACVEELRSQVELQAHGEPAFQSVEDLHRSLKEHPLRRQYLIQNLEYRVIGMLTLTHLEDSSINALLENVYLIPSERQKGYAELCVREALCQHKARYPTSNVCAVDVLSCDVRAKALYRKLGFEPVIEEHLLYF